MVLAVLLSAGPPGRAQELQRIAAVVNDEIISFYDLAARIDLVIASTGLDDNLAIRREILPQVLQGLISERLQIQEAERLDIEVTEDDILFAIAAFEAQSNVLPGSYMEFLASESIDSEKALQQIHAQVAWGKLIRQRFVPSIVVGPDEVDAAATRLEADWGKPLYRVGEIFLAVDTMDQEEKVRADALSLVTRLRNGAAFSPLARQFSQSASAAVGGDLGWLKEVQLAPEIAAQIATMKPGALSDPIRTVEGYHIILLVESQTPAVATALETEIELAQIVLPLAPDASRDEAEAKRSAARAIAATVAGCDELIGLAREMDAPMSGELGRLRMKDLPDDILGAVIRLPVGVASEPVRTENGWHVMMVCERDALPEIAIDREKIQRELIERRLELMARRYLRDLRSLAFIDVRI